MDGLLGIFHCEKGGQVRSVCWYGDENAEPIASSENATWNNLKKNIRNKKKMMTPSENVDDLLCCLIQLKHLK